MKLSDYSKVTELANDNIFLIDTVNGTRTITAEALLKAISDTFSPKDIFEKIDLSTISSAIGLEDDDLVFLGRAGGNKTMNAKEFLKTLQLDFTKLTEAEQVALTDKLLINDGTGNKSINIENLLKTLNFNVLTEVQEFAEDDNLIVSSPTEGNRIIPASQVGTKLDLNALPVAETATDSDLILLGTSEGNKSITKGNLTKGWKISYDDLDEFIDPKARASLFRGKNLGNTFTEEQSARIKDGSFKGFFLGDYWEDTVNNVKWRIADFDYWLNIGGSHATDEEKKKHHLVILPDSCLDTQQYNTVNNMVGGWKNMSLFQSGRENANSKMISFFGSHVITRVSLINNTVDSATASYPTAGEFANVGSFILNEVMVFGSTYFAVGPTGSAFSYRYITEKNQLALFKIIPQFIVTNPAANYWLNDIVNNNLAGLVSAEGTRTVSGITNSQGVRIAFSIN